MMAFERMPFERRVDALVELLGWVEEQVRGMINALVAREPQGAGTLLWLRKRQAVLDAMLRNASRDVGAALPPLFEDAWRFGLLIGRVRGEFGMAVPNRSIDLLAQGLRHDIDEALYTVGRRVRDLFRELTMKQVAIHIVAGTGAKDEAKTLQAALERRGTRAFVDKAGREWSLKNYTDMAIRTVTREAVTQGTVAAMENNGEVLTKFSHHAGSCDQCLEYDGKTFALPGHTVSGYRTLRPDELAPIHPRCKHVNGPAPANFDRLEQELLNWKARQGAPAAS